MSNQALIQGLGVFLHAVWPAAAAALGAAAAVGMLKAMTRIDDRAVSFAARFAAVALVIYFFAGKFSGDFFEFVLQLWGSRQTYL